MTIVETSKILVTEHEAESRSPLAVKNVLFATDFSPTSEAALPYAAAICRHFGSTLHMVHVISEAGLLMMSSLVILSGVFCREGPMQFAGAGRLHRSFASLRMTNAK